MKPTPVPSPERTGLGAAIKVREVADYLKLIGRRVSINDTEGIVKDLADSGRYLILVGDSPPHRESRIPLDSIGVIEVLDARQSVAHGAEPSASPTRRRRVRKAQAPALPRSPTPITICYDERTDSAYIRLSPSHAVASKPVTLGTTIDYDAQNKPVGIEFKQATKHLGYDRPVLAKLRFKPSLDAAADCLHLVLPGIRKEKSIEAQEGISLGHDRDGRLAQITIASASNRLDLQRLGAGFP